MSRRIYRVLLRLLPRRRRARFGADMIAVFDELRQQEQRDRGRLAGVWLWVLELAGMCRFVLREWIAAIGATLFGGPGMASELRWAWRGIRHRGWGAVLMVVLVAGAIGVTAATFSAADALVFNRYPFPNADRVVRLEQRLEGERRPNRQIVALLHDEWQRHRDVFSAVGGYFTKGGVFLLGERSSEQVAAADITIEMLDVLGVTPRWGRTFAEADLAASGVYAAILSEDLARRKFGEPERALGQRLAATGRPLVVIGVMDANFAFPGAGTDLWRLMDPRGPLTVNFTGLTLIARVAPGVPLEAAPTLVQSRAARVAEAVSLPEYTVTMAPYFARSPREVEFLRDRDRLWMLLFGAGLALLIISCANMASLELAHAVRRRHVHAVQCALGASRLSLARIAAMEGLVIVGTSLVSSVFLANGLLQLATSYVPARVLSRGFNPIDVDGRVIAFAAATAMLAWVLASGPAVFLVGRTPGLMAGTRSVTPGRSGLRRLLTAVQVGLAVALVAVGVLYSRSYRELLALDKGFDSAGVALVSVAMPSDYFASGGERLAVTNRLLDEVRGLPGVLAASRSHPPPDVPTPVVTPLWIDGVRVMEEARFSIHAVDLAYFDVTRLALLAGRFLQPGEPGTNVLIPASFARRFWPNGAAVGGTIRGPDCCFYMGTFTVVGIVDDFRQEPTRMPGPEDRLLYAYALWAPPPEQPQQEVRAFADNGGSYAFLNVSVRVESPAALPAVQAAVQRMDPRLAVSLQIVDDIYADQHAHMRLASRAIAAFSLVSFAIAIAGLYGVVAYVVASRTREIGIRMALGAAAGDIRRMVLMTSGRMVVAGGAGGMALAFVIARWTESQLFGVSAADPTTYALVAAAAGSAALAATWVPARRAAATDPAVTLRAE